MKVSSRWSQRLAEQSLEQLRGSRLPAVDDLDHLEALIHQRISEISTEHLRRKLSLLRNFLIAAPVLIGTSVAVLVLVLGGGVSDFVLLGMLTSLFSVLIPIFFLSELDAIAANATESSGRLTGRQILAVFGGPRAVPLQLARHEFDARPYNRHHSIKSALTWELTQLTDRERHFLRGHLNSPLSIAELLAAFESCDLPPE